MLQFNYNAAWLWNSTAAGGPLAMRPLGQTPLHRQFCSVLVYSGPFFSALPCSVVLQSGLVRFVCSAPDSRLGCFSSSLESTAPSFVWKGKVHSSSWRGADLCRQKSPPLIPDWFILIRPRTLDSQFDGSKKHCPE